MRFHARRTEVENAQTLKTARSRQSHIGLTIFKHMTERKLNTVQGHSLGRKKKKEKKINKHFQLSLWEINKRKVKETFHQACIHTVCTTLDKKKNHPRGSRREERCSTCDIMLDQARSAQGKSREQSRIELALRWSCLIEHDITRGTAFFSPRISMMLLFFCPG